MSGIFGISHRPCYVGETENAMKALRYWNRLYGSQEYGSMTFPDGGIGIHVEHFSDVFPHGGTVLDFHGMPAVVDALLYNRDELSDLLGLHADPRISDEELLLTLIQTHGFDALCRVNGDFAGAIYDAQKREWTLFRDHLGVRPLFYYLDKTQFAFSTDIRGLTAIPGADTSPNAQAVYRKAMCMNILTLCQTDYANIQGVRPGSWIVIRQTPEGFETHTHVYWRLRQKKIRLGSDAEYQAELRRLVTDAVQRRLDAIPGVVGAELSGGLDSSVIDILINRLGRECRYYSWSMDPKILPLRQGADERKVILDICDQEHIQCKFSDSAQKPDFWSMAEVPTPAHIDTIAMSAGSKWIRSQGAQVVFSGHGGDEGISHRCNRFELFHNHEYLSYFKLYRQDMKGRKLPTLRALRRGLIDAGKNKKLLTSGYQYSKHDASMLLCAQFRGHMASQCPNESVHFGTEPHRYVEQGGSRPRLENAAYQGAVNGVRYLFPYIDHRVMDFAVSIPRRLYLDQTQDRLIFREAFRDIIPESLYRLDYKDLASQREAPRDTDPAHEFRDDFARFRERLDQEYWKDILDINALDRVPLPDSYRSPDYMRCVMIQNLLHRCILVQNVCKLASKWRDTDE